MRDRDYLISRVTLPGPAPFRGRPETEPSHPSSRADLVIRDGIVENIQPPGSARAEGLIELDGDGLVALPTFAEPHVHLDKAMTAGIVAARGGDLASAVAAWVAARPSMTTRDITHRALETAYRYLAHGTRAIRTHTDTGPGIGTRASPFGRPRPRAPGQPAP